MVAQYGENTVRDILKRSLRLLNVIESQEEPSPDDLNIVLNAFQDMISSWSNNSLLIYSIKPYIFNCVAGQDSYLLGPGKDVLTLGTITPGTSYVNGIYYNVPLVSVTGTGAGATANITISGGVVTAASINLSNTYPNAGGSGYSIGDSLTVSNTNLGGFGSGFSVLVATIGLGDWVIPRPLRIEQAYVIWQDGNSQQLDIPVQLLNNSQFASISVKQTPSQFPFVLFNDMDYPLSKVSVWPVPNLSIPLRLWLREPLLNFDNIDGNIEFPPGYKRAFAYNLAVEVAPEFSRAVPQEVVSVATQSIIALESLNTIAQYQQGDSGLNKASGRRWSYITGGFVPFR